MNPIPALPEIPDTPLIYRPPADCPTVLHEDAHVLVVDKPAGLLSVPGRLPEHHESALLRLQAIYGPLWVVHRLDMDTSGLMAFARTREAAAHLGRQFERRSVKKTYEALVWGFPPSACGVIDLPLRIDWPHRPRQLVDGVGGKRSVTLYEWITAGSGTNKGPALNNRPPTTSNARLKLTPITGRSHQLRVHCSAIGLTIVGDRFYGHPTKAQAPQAERLMLHARTLTVEHPRENRVIEVESPPGF